MDELARFALLALGVVVAALLLYALLRYTMLALWWMGSAVSSIHGDLRDAADMTGERLRQKARKRASFRRLNAMVGGTRPTSSANPELLRARTQTPVIRRLVQGDIPHAIRRCLQIHRVMAIAVGAEFMHEIAEEPECQLMRERVGDLVEITVEMLQEYPLLLDDASLLQNVVVLRKKILPTCRECPYLQHAVDTAPPLCPSAQMAQFQGEACKSNEPRS